MDEAIVVDVSELKSGSDEKERGSEVALGAATLGEKWAAIVEAMWWEAKGDVFFFRMGDAGILGGIKGDGARRAVRP